MRFRVLQSGSKGNCTYIETNKNKILLDCGVSYTRCKNYLLENDVNIDEVNAIFITHEHIDHTNSIVGIMNKLPHATLYITKPSFLALKEEVRNKLIKYNIRYIEENTIYQINDAKIYTLLLSHDASMCLGYIFEEIETKTRLAYSCDTGFIHVNYLDLFRACDYIIIEANHNIELLENSNRPIFHIQRVLSIKGHMNNVTCFEILNSIINNRIKKVILGHISDECNSLDCINKEIIEPIKLKHNYTNIICASRSHALDMVE